MTGNPLPRLSNQVKFFKHLQAQVSDNNSADNDLKYSNELELATKLATKLKVKSVWKLLNKIAFPIFALPLLDDSNKTWEYKHNGCIRWVIAVFKHANYNDFYKSKHFSLRLSVC